MSRGSRRDAKHSTLSLSKAWHDGRGALVLVLGLSSAPRLGSPVTVGPLSFLAPPGCVAGGSPAPLVLTEARAARARPQAPGVLSSCRRRCACAWLRIELLPRSQGTSQGIRPQRPALCSSQGVISPWKTQRRSCWCPLPCSPALPPLSLAAEDPTVAASSSFGAALRCWLHCPEGAQHSSANSHIAWRASGQGSGVRSRGNPLPCHAGG